MAASKSKRSVRTAQHHPQADPQLKSHLFDTLNT